jgi:thiol-disulfide isomerase/thioredoxin
MSTSSSALARTFVRCLVVVTLSCLAVRAAEPKAKQEIDPKAQKVLEAFDKYYAGLDGFQVTVNVALTIERSGQKESHEFTQKLAIQRPNKLALRLEPSKMTQGGGTIVSDGRELSAYFKAFDKYGVEKAPEAFAGLLQNPLVQGALSVGNATAVTLALLDDHPAKKLLEETKSLQYAGPVKLDGAQCHLLKATGDELDWQLWIDAGDKPLVRQFVPDLTKAFEKMAKANKGKSPLANVKLTNIVAFVDWKANPKFAIDAFVFNVPKGIAKVLSLADILAGGREPDETGPHPLVGQAAPQMQLDLLDGGTLDLASYKGKKIVILDFWATWCGPCTEAMPIIEKVAAQYKDKGVLLFAVNVEEGADDVRKFLDDAKLKVTVALDKDGDAARAYKAEGIPQTVLVGKDGSVQVVHVGLLPDLEEQLAKELDGLLAGKNLAAETLAAAKEKAGADAADSDKADADKAAAKPAAPKADKAGKK